MFDACRGLFTHKRGALVVNEVQDHGDAEDVQAGMDLLGLAGKDLDDDVGDDAGADAGGDVGGKRTENDHHEGAEGLSEVGEVNLSQAADHQKAHEDQGRAGGGVGDYHEQGGGEDSQQKHDAGGEGGEACWRKKPSEW